MMEKSHILVIEIKPGITFEPLCWQFCVSSNGAFEYAEAEGWSFEQRPIKLAVEGNLTEPMLLNIKQIISTLDQIEKEPLPVEGSGSIGLTYRRPDGTIGTVNRGGILSTEGDAFSAVFHTIREIMVARGLDGALSVQ